jgi:hypothetical protein
MKIFQLTDEMVQENWNRYGLEYMGHGALIFFVYGRMRIKWYSYVVLPQ